MILWLDTETFSAIPIKNGAHRYAEGAEVMLVPYAVDDAPTIVWDTQDRPDWARGLQALIDAADTIVLHNSAFDRTVLRVAHGVVIPVDKIDDTMVIAYQHSLPGSLGALCDVLGVPQDKAKDKTGKKLIHLFTKPRPKNTKIRRATRETHPDEWQQFVEYARLDVDAMREVHRRLPRWNCTVRERALWVTDQSVNDRGIAVDVDLAHAAIRAFQRASGALATRAARLTDGAVGSTTQRGKLLAHLASEYDLHTDDLTKGTVDALLRAGGLDDGARELLENRRQASATSPAKYGALIGAASSDGRLRGTSQFCGASRTGRDAGRIFQPTNLPRSPSWFDADVQEITIAAFKADCDDLLWDNVSERCAFAVRGSLIAAAGTKLVAADLKNIEGRLLAWGAGEQWKVDAFKAFDAGTGHDLYKIAAGRILGKSPADVTKDERQLTGKVSELACGYAGGLGAFRVMGGPAVESMSDDAIRATVGAWRAAHPRIKAFWYDMERAAKAAIWKPGFTFEVRFAAAFDVKEDQCGVPWLRMRLPGGRYLCYPRPAVEQEKCERCLGDGDVAFEHEGESLLLKCPKCGGAGKVGFEQITHEGTNQYTRKWERLSTYGGKLVENWTQATARDVFMHGLLAAEAAGYPAVLRVYDELVCEVPSTAAWSVETLAGLMSCNPPWAVGLPLAADGFEAPRYRKD